jgi:hypothetical protein
MEPKRELDTRTVRLGLAGLVVVAVIVFLAVKLLGGDDDNTDTDGPVGLSEEELIDRAGDFDHPIYWVGPDPSVDQYELTATSDGRVYVRYLVSGAAPGDQRPSFRTVGTYEVADAKVSLQTSKDAGGTGSLTHENGFDLLRGGSRQNVYVALDDQTGLQIEIFDPQPGAALELAKSGALKPIE